MNSIKFPDIFGSPTTVNIVSDYDATLQNLKCLLLSDKQSLFGDPFFGVGLRRYLFDLNDYILQDILIDLIYSSVSVFMPQLRLTRDDITIESDGYRVTVTLKAINLKDFQTNLYNIVLLDTTA